MKKKLNILVISFVLIIVTSVGVIIFNYPANKSEWTLEKLIAESDCCVVLRDVRGYFCYTGPYVETKENEGSNREEILVVDERDELYFPDKHFILVQEFKDYKPTLEYIPGDSGSDRPPYILFLTKADDGDYYYITGGKSGAIKIIDDRLEALDENLKFEVWLKFKNDYKNFEQWRINEYEFSDKMIPIEKPTRIEFDINNTTIPQIVYSNIETTAPWNE
ncbi:MAG: hypothetical protein E7557_09010 [Ruminococcaceae bacterium]|nr:hypothetical protein [Oscillospiraceae bacterium]